MGLRYRKSINLGGGFRVNLSKNGIGYSWGVKGYRVTKTADGKTRQTVSIPGTGISYVEEHGSGRNTSKRAESPVDPLASYSDIETVESADISNFQSPLYDELFKQIKHTRKIAYLILFLSIFVAPFSPVLIFACIGLAIYYLSSHRYMIEYEFDDTEREKWDALSTAWRGIASSQSLQEITMTAKSRNVRENAGIENAYDTIKMRGDGTLPFSLKTNIEPIVFAMKDKQIAIMPDRLLVFTKKDIGVLDYADIKFDLSAVGFLESGPVPGDAELVKMVWGYANKDGSPDKRYTNNKQFPVMKYGQIIMTSKSGLDVRFMCSNEAAMEQLYHIINGEEN